MATYLILLAAALVGVTHAAVSGHLAAGTCLCVHGTTVNARNQAGTTGTQVVSTHNTGECFKLFSATEVNKDGYVWYQLHSGSTNFWIAGNYLDQAADAQCSTAAGGACTAHEQTLACQLFRSANIQAARVHPSGVTDNGFPYNNLRDMCDGKKASRSHYTCDECTSPGAPGGTVCLSANLLEYLVELQSHGKVIINELAGACHSCSSRHYSGLAVDLHMDSRSSEYLRTCTAMKGWGQNEGNHIHCQFYDAPHPSW